MRYPTGLSNQDFLDHWYNAQAFGAKTDYGYHEGDDINKTTGGDSDLGQPLYAVYDGEIVYYHDNSHPTKNFGRHMVLRCQTPQGVRWWHYAHCQEITAEVKKVKEGDVIGKLGKSGTTAAHLHFSCFKVDPILLLSGIDSIAKTQQQLNDWWESPLRFLAANQGTTPTLSSDDIAVNKKTFEDLVNKSTHYDAFVALGYTTAEQVSDLEKRFREKDTEIVGLHTEVSSRKKEYSDFIEELAKKLGIAASSDKSDVLAAIDRELENDEAKRLLEKELEQTKQDHRVEVLELKAEIEALKRSVDTERVHLQEAQKKNETLMIRVEKIEQKLTETQSTQQSITVLEKILNLFRK